jgi:L-seryl-tRNA(Ser) seleniumtransferase
VHDVQAKLRQLPAVEKVLQAAAGEQEFQNKDRKVAVEAVRRAVDKIRALLKNGVEADTSVNSLLLTAKEEMAAMLLPNLRRVINATGTILHTNLGRAPLSERAQAAITGVMKGYSSLEIDLETGGRGSRYDHVTKLICQLTGAEDTVVVNNNAAAVVLAISTVASGREVIVSRGELVEIGGSFRIPDVIRQSGARLVEVGTTNKTHLADYRQAVTSETAAILKVHTSNYRIVGFTAQPDPAELVAFGQEKGVPVIEDLGSGTLLPVTIGGSREPSVAERISQGFCIVTFSGDKLFGAGQAGIIAGKKRYVEMMKKHPLLRAFRIDKLSLASLEGTLMDYAYGNPRRDIPVHRMLDADPALLKQKADRLVSTLKEAGLTWDMTTVEMESSAGGGSLPEVFLAGYGVSVLPEPLSAAAVERQLRQRDVPIIIRVKDNRILFDIRCLADEDYAVIAAACIEISGKGAKV